MEPRIAMVLAHPYTREVVALATRSLHKERPVWELDPNLQQALWNFTERIAEYASRHTFVLEQVAEYARHEMVFTRLPGLRPWIDETHQDIHQRFSSLQGVGEASCVYECLLRIAAFTAVVAQCQSIDMDPQQFLG